MSVRVIAGRARGLRLSVPDAPQLRPTSDRARETLFNVLAPRLSGARFLDAFAGCGAVGIEALSRGAAQAVFVERNRRAAAMLQENLVRCDFVPEAEVLVLSWRAAVQRLSAGASCFDIAFFDPPYDRPDAHTCVEDLRTAGLLTRGGIAIVEHRKSSPPQIPADWTLGRRLDVSETTFSFFEP